jgi:AraC-like DNA-binding protein
MMLVIFCIVVFYALRLIQNPMEKRASQWLGAFFLCCAIDVMPQIIGFAGFYAQWPGLTFFPFNTECWLGALLYLHTYSLMHEKPLGWRKYLILPGIIQTTYYTWAFLFLGDYKQKWAFNDAFHEPFILPIETVASVALTLFALLQIHRATPRYKIYLQEFSAKALACDPAWLDNLFKASLLTAAVFIVLELTTLFSTLSYIDAFPFQIAIMMVIAWLSMDAFTRLNQAFPKIDTKRIEHDSVHSNKVKNAKDWSALGEKMTAAIEQRQLFLDPEFSLLQLAGLVGTNEVYASKAFNIGMSCTFNEFVNQRRIAFAKNLLKETDQSILDAGLSSGFAAKSTFNRVFKAYVGLTPTQFRQQSITR